MCLHGRIQFIPEIQYPSNRVLILWALQELDFFLVYLGPEIWRVLSGRFEPEGNTLVIRSTQLF